jgi:vancomycin permeability regulator SanA
MKLLPLTRKQRLRLLGFALVVLVTLPLSALVLIVVAKREVEAAAQGRVASTVDEVPPTPVALVLGCSRTLESGAENPFFANRIDAAVELYESGKVEVLLVSGDNSRPDYDESSDMKAALMVRGVPADAIVCDYAGFSTLDSVVRAKEVFGQTRLVVVSQGFHVRRALYIAQAHDIEATGYAADRVGGAGGRIVHLRECLARVKVLLDVRVLHRGPKFLGEPVAIATKS